MKILDTLPIILHITTLDISNNGFSGPLDFEITSVNCKTVVF